MKTAPNIVPLAGLVSAEFLSHIGNQIAAVAIPLLVLEYTRSPLATGLVGAAAVVPVILAAVVGGRSIDRIGAWRVSVVADALSFLSVLALPAVILSFVDIPLPLILGLVFMGALFDPTGVASRQVMTPVLARVARVPLARVNAVRGGLENGADSLGPVIGGGLILLVGATHALFVNAASFLVAIAITIVAVPRPRRARTMPAPAGSRSALRFILRHPSLRGLAFTGMVANAVVLPFIMVWLPIIASWRFGAPAFLGVCLAVFGVAAALGAFAYARLSAVLSASRIFYGGLIVTALSIVYCGFSGTVVGVIMAVAVAGLLLGAGNPLEQTLLHEATPAAQAGRVFTTLTAIRYAGGPLGLVLAGAAAEASAVGISTAVGGGILLTTAIAGWWLMPLETVELVQREIT